MGRPCGQLIGQLVAASARSSQAIFSGSSRMLILIAARQAMEAAIARRKSSSDSLAQLALRNFQNLEQHFLDIPRV